MSLSDPIADYLTRIRNATVRKHASVKIPYSVIKANMSEVLYKEGFIENWKIEGKLVTEKHIVIQLKYDKVHDSVIRGLKRISKPGCRFYSKVDQMKKILGGQGISVVSTSKGVISDSDCRRLHTGGEVLFYVW